MALALVAHAHQIVPTLKFQYSVSEAEGLGMHIFDHPWYWHHDPNGPCMSISQMVVLLTEDWWEASYVNSIVPVARRSNVRMISGAVSCDTFRHDYL